MKVALFNAFPNLSISAEREFIQRCITVLKRLGHAALEVMTSDEIMEYNPDFVLITHEFIPKITHHYTVGLLWSPTQFYKNDVERIKSIRSWDLIIPVNDSLRNFAKDLHFPIRHQEAVSSINIVPSSPISYYSVPKIENLSVAYVGSHWDGSRHERLFKALSSEVDLNVYGPEKAWRFLPGCYRGSLPLDGESVIQALNKHGVALAIHHAAHVEEDTPSMRVFEAVAAKCIVITDPLPSLVKTFGDTLHYIDTHGSPESIVTEITSIIQKYKANPELHARIIEQISTIFENEVSLNVLLRNLINDVESRIKARSVNTLKCSKKVSAIIRCGSRPMVILQRAVESLRNQTYQDIGLIFVRFEEIEGFHDWKNELIKSGRFLFVKEILAEMGSRSASMWAGLKAVDTDYFSLLDDDDEIFPNHIASLVSLLEERSQASFAFTGVIRREEDGKLLNSHYRFQGDLLNEVLERRELFFFDDFDIDRLLRHDNFIQSNTWLARNEVLTPDVLDDPNLNVSEDLYFYLLLASRCQFIFSGTVSALWNWRSLAQDNTAIKEPIKVWETARDKIRRRLSNVRFQGAYLGKNFQDREHIQQITQEIPPIQVLPPNKPDSNLVDSVLKRIFKKKAEVIPPGEPDYHIDFSSERLPAFIVNTNGLSHCESWGRWTVGSRVVLKIRHKLPRKCIISVVGHAFESNHGLPVTIKVGSALKSFQMSSKNGFKNHIVEICCEEAAEIIEILNPNPKSPFEVSCGRNNDKRTLGIALKSISIYENSQNHK